MQVTERPGSLVAELTDLKLKTKLESCANGPFYKSDFVIAHRGAPLGYPEHTKEGYIAAAEMGAGLIECDVTFTNDGALVCRHSQCDLHRTTNILQTPLAAQCTTAFAPATATSTAEASCCTSDISLAEYRTLCARPDYVNPKAESVETYLTLPNARVEGDLTSCGTLMTHAESIDLIDSLDAKFVPELKAPMVDMPYNGMSQRDYAQTLIEEYQAAGVSLKRVFPQSFNLADVFHWIQTYPEIAHQVVYLDGRGRNPDFEPTLSDMQELYGKGLRIIAPPIPVLVRLNANGDIVPTDYALLAKEAGLEIITWTFEAGVATDPRNFTYFTTREVIANEGDSLKVLHALHEKVGIKGIFTDWAGTVTYYASCVGVDPT